MFNKILPRSPYLRTVIVSLPGIVIASGGFFFLLANLKLLPHGANTLSSLHTDGLVGGVVITAGGLFVTLLALKFFRKAKESESQIVKIQNELTENEEIEKPVIAAYHPHINYTINADYVKKKNYSLNEAFLHEFGFSEQMRVEKDNLTLTVGFLKNQITSNARFLTEQQQNKLKQFLNFTGGCIIAQLETTPCLFDGLCLINHLMETNSNNDVPVAIMNTLLAFDEKSICTNRAKELVCAAILIANGYEEGQIILSGPAEGSICELISFLNIDTDSPEVLITTLFDCVINLKKTTDVLQYIRIKLNALDSNKGHIIIEEIYDENCKLKYNAIEAVLELEGVLLYSEDQQGSSDHLRSKLNLSTNEITD